MKNEKLDLDLIKKVFENRADLFDFDKILSSSKKIEKILEKEPEMNALNILLIISSRVLNFEDVNRRAGLFSGYVMMLMKLLETGLYMDAFDIKQINKVRLN